MKKAQEQGFWAFRKEDLIYMDAIEVLLKPQDDCITHMAERQVTKI